MEDAKISATILREQVAALGLVNPVVHVDHGDRAVAWLRTAAEAGRPPALVLLDVILPGASGVQILRWLREHPGLQDVPVVILTATADMADIQEAHQLGVASYLVKPVGYDALGEVVRNLPCHWALLGPRGDE